MKAVTYFQPYGEAGQWHEADGPQGGNPFILRSLDQAAWLAGAVFDGARSFEGVAPDLEHHCARLIESAKRLKYIPPLSAEQVTGICREAIGKFPKDALLYIRPEFFATEGLVMANREKISFACSVFEAPWSKESFTACLSTYCRPDPRSAPTLAKAAGVYPTLHLALIEARGRGFDASVMLDLDGNVAEFTSANLMFAKGGKVYTPRLNGTFLNGITRQRIAGLLQEDGVEVTEQLVTIRDLMEADELFAVGNLYKVHPCVKLEEKTYPIGPIAKRAKALYWDFAHGRLKTKTKIVV